MTAAKTNTKPSPLGRGLSALFGDADAGYQPRPAAMVASIDNTAGKKAAGMSKMPVEWLQPGAFQPRRKFDDEPLEELAASIRERGILQPLLVRAIPNEQNAYEIVAGERRWRAAQLAGVHEVPVLVREITDREAMEIGLIENVQRQGLSPLEEGEGYKRLLEEFKHTHDGLAKVVGKSRSYISNAMRLLSLPDSVKQMIETGALSVGHARALVVSKNPKAAAEEVVRKGLSVRQTEELMRREAEGPAAKKKTASASAIDNDVLALEKELERMIGLKVKLVAKGPGGSLTIHYKNLDQLDEIVRRLKG